VASDSLRRLWGALKEKRMMAILLLGASSGLPFNLTLSTLQAWLADAGVDIKTIGIFALVGLPYTFKFLWAPMLDRYLPPLLGRRRGWIVILQMALALAIGAMSFSEPAKFPTEFGAIALLVVFLSASQDIVIDAYRVDILPPQQRALASAVTSFGYRGAAMFASSVVVIIAAFIGWHLAYGVAAVVMALMVFATLWSPEPPTAVNAPRTLSAAVVEPIRDFLQHPGAWGLLLLVPLYKVGDAFALSLYSAFMIKGVGFSLVELGTAGKPVMTISTLIGVSLGGAAYLRWGLYRCLMVFGIAQALTLLLFMVLSYAGRKVWLLAVVTCVDTLAGGMGQAVFVAFLMCLCTTAYSATQYALLSAMSSWARVVMSSQAGKVVAAVGWPHFFMITFLTCLPGLILLFLLRDRIRSLDAREKASAAAPPLSEGTVS
jgi:PAT family beta-lactamase induction signal transducer AmpG